MRLALSMSGSLVVGVAEVVVYAGYLRRVGEAKEKEKERGMKEVKEIVGSWVVGNGKGEEGGDGALIGDKEETEAGDMYKGNARKRR